jgi:hypothetical protein
MVLFLISIFFIIDNKGMAMTGRPYDYYREKLKEVNISDGVSKEEAIIIAQNYIIDKIKEGGDFYKKLGISKPEFSDDSKYKNQLKENWVILFPMRYGFLKTWNVIYVNKQTGKVVDGGPMK